MSGKNIDNTIRIKIQSGDDIFEANAILKQEFNDLRLARTLQGHDRKAYNDKFDTQIILSDKKKDTDGDEYTPVTVKVFKTNSSTIIATDSQNIYPLKASGGSVDANFEAQYIMDKEFNKLRNSKTIEKKKKKNYNDKYDIEQTLGTSATDTDGSEYTPVTIKMYKSGDTNVLVQDTQNIYKMLVIDNSTESSEENIFPPKTIKLTNDNHNIISLAYKLYKANGGTNTETNFRTNVVKSNANYYDSLIIQCADDCISLGSSDDTSTYAFFNYLGSKFPIIDTKNITDFSRCFENLANVNGNTFPDFSQSATATSTNFSNFDFKSASDLSFAFVEKTSGYLTTTPTLKNVPSVLNSTESMFAGQTKMTSVNVSYIGENAKGMFSGLTALNALEVSVNTNNHLIDITNFVGKAYFNNTATKALTSFKIDLDGSHTSLISSGKLSTTDNYFIFPLNGQVICNGIGDGIKNLTNIKLFNVPADFDATSFGLKDGQYTIVTYNEYK